MIEIFQGLTEAGMGWSHLERDKNQVQQAALMKSDSQEPGNQGLSTKADRGKLTGRELQLQESPEGSKAFGPGTVQECAPRSGFFALTGH